jgi:MFS-type transporter involved in bile tolerance (Atg22 family)
LTKNTEILVAYTSRFTASQFGASVIFLLLMITILRSAGIGNGQEVLAAQVSQTSVFLVTTIFFGIAWSGLFKERKASQSIPEGTTLVNAGFFKLFRTAKEITTYHTALKWFLVSAAMTQSATTSFSSIAITYMTDQLHFGPGENAIAILLLLVFAVPGARLAQVLTRWITPIQSLKCCLLLWMIATTSAAFVLRGKGQELMAYVFAIVWGLCIGWVYPTEKALYCSIIPSGQDAELMGVYIFACQIFSWLPPFVFSAMNEARFSLRAGLFSLTGYYFVSFAVLHLLIGDYRDAVHHANTFVDKESVDVYVATPEKATTPNGNQMATAIT